ncbi:MAG TPA: hypothetical protein VFO36_02570, partial [Nitrospiraceae bacterium]|nr:hypothetical protein [Nitrospiraceae bacterium]
MADNPAQSSPSRGNATAHVAGNDNIDAMEKQLSQLRREITKINSTLADRVEEAVDEAAGWYDSASEGASVATRALRSQAERITQVTRQ